MILILMVEGARAVISLYLASPPPVLQHGGDQVQGDQRQAPGGDHREPEQAGADRGGARGGEEDGEAGGVRHQPGGEGGQEVGGGAQQAEAAGREVLLSLWRS